MKTIPDNEDAQELLRTLPKSRIVTTIWHCHDGWACSVSFITDGQENHDLDLAARKKWAELFKTSWYRSSRTQADAHAKLSRKLAIATLILPGVPVIEQP